MNNTQLYKALEKVVTNRVYEQLKDSVIVQEKDSYRLFESYRISNTKKGFSVQKINVHGETVFSYLKYAVTWAILDKKNSISEASRVKELDQKLASLDINIKLYEKLEKKSKNQDTKLLYLCKRTEAVNKKKIVSQELDVFVARTKAWQLQKFSNSSYNSRI